MNDDSSEEIREAVKQWLAKADIDWTSVEILTVCEFGKISTLAAATLSELGFRRVTALDGGMAAWREQGNTVETG